MKQSLKTLLELSKFKISAFSTLSTTIGYVLASGRLSLEMLIPTTGILFLACGSATLNQYQERGFDAAMLRTQKRPIPSGKVKPGTALLVSLSLIFIGGAVLFFGTNLLAFSLGLLAVFWYNGVYTFLKTKTAFAVVPGALIGSIPPAVGWVAGGGSIADPQLWILAFFFFIWQVPHFWLLLLLFGEDYQRAGLPTLTSVFSRPQLRRITFVWIAGTAMACLLIPLFGLVRFSLVNFGLVALALWLIWNSAKTLIARAGKSSFGFAFKEINIYALAVLLLISMHRLLR